jgi:hypothetical protein
LSRKLNQLRQEKVQLEHTLEQEQECLVNKLMRKIEKLETETGSKQATLDQLRREKVELENTLEQEQEALVNKLWKRMDKLESEKRGLQIKLDQPVSEPPSPREVPGRNSRNGDTAANLANNIHQLRQECAKLKQQLTVGELNHRRKMSEFEKEEKHIREENLRLQRKLQLEMDRREALCRHLSESESSLEMEEERVVNEMMITGAGMTSAGLTSRGRAVSSPVPGPYSGQPPSPSPTLSRPLSPGLNFGKAVLLSPLTVPARREEGVRRAPAQHLRRLVHAARRPRTLPLRPPPGLLPPLARPPGRRPPLPPAPRPAPRGRGGEAVRPAGGAHHRVHQPRRRHRLLHPARLAQHQGQPTRLTHGHQPDVTPTRPPAYFCDIQEYGVSVFDDCCI